MKKVLSRGLLGFAVFLLHFSLRAVPGDEHWDPQFNWPGTTNVIYGIAVHNGNIYAGGNVSAGSATNAALEVWDGLQWSTMGLFTGGSAPEIYDIAFAGDTLYVAGTFNAVNGTTIRGLAKWNGTSWTSAGLTGVVLGLAADGNNLYAAGVFTNADAGGMVMTNVGYWDGSAWHALGGGVGKPGSGNPRAIVVKNGMVYSGGIFTNSGSQLITNLAVWNGSSRRRSRHGVFGSLQSGVQWKRSIRWRLLYAGRHHPGHEHCQMGRRKLVGGRRWRERFGCQ